MKHIDSITSRSLQGQNSSDDEPSDKFSLLAKLDEMKKAIDGYKQYKMKSSSNNSSTLLSQTNNSFVITTDNLDESPQKLILDP